MNENRTREDARGHRDPHARRAGFRTAIGIVVLTVAALSTPWTHARSMDVELSEITIDELKRVYLACGRAALAGRLDGASIMQCSVVYETLKERAFGGDFGELLVWSRANQSSANVER